jgi:CRISPR-associated endonuclease Csn1
MEKRLNTFVRPIKSVRCFTGLSAVVPVKKDEEGKDIGFVKPGNNHHIAIYTDKDGKKIEHVCTFWHAVERKKYGVPVIIKDASEVWDKIQLQPEGTYSESFLEKLPDVQLKLELSMQQNEMFVLGMTNEDIQLAIETKDYKTISDKLYRVQKLGSSDYTFRHHLETQLSDEDSARISKRFYRIKSTGSLFGLNPYKLKVDRLGNISM